MKLRLDLLEHLTESDLLEEVLETNSRYKPEPLFSKIGVGSLSSASIEQRAQEAERSTELIEKLTERARQDGKTSESRALSGVTNTKPACCPARDEMTWLSSTRNPF